MVKLNLQANTTERRRAALEEKFRKFEMRTRKEEMKEVQKVWVAAITYAGSVLVFHHKFENRKVPPTQALHIRSESALKFLTLTCLCVGVILRKRSAIRKRRALVVLRRLSPYVAKWTIRKRKQCREEIASFFEKAMTQDVVYQLMRRWVRNLLMVQRAVKQFLTSRKLMYATLKHTWNLTEVEIHKNLAKSKAFQTDFAYEGLSSIPEVVKDYYLRGGLQQKFIAYFEEVKKYRTECERLRKLHQENSLETAAEAILLGLKPEDLYYEVPLPPVFTVYLTKSDVKGLILEAETNRLNWDKIMQKNKNARLHRTTIATDRSRSSH